MPLQSIRGKPRVTMTILAMIAAMSMQSQWAVISKDLMAELGKTHPESADIYARGTAGISVDRSNGDVYLLANNIGICKSTDQGKSFKLVSGNVVTGRFETNAGLNIDPAGGRLMCFTIYGSSGYSPDAGKTWTPSTLGHLDYGAVDWSDTGKALLAVVHESDGKLAFSADAGKVWKTLGTGFWGAGLFDRNTLLSNTSDGIVRSVDGGQTWQLVSQRKAAAPVMMLLKGKGYWLSKDGLIVSKDKGLNWTLIGPVPKGASLGPLFGKDEKHMVVGSPEGLFESTDGGLKWVRLAPPAPEITILNGGLYGTYGWDSVRRIVYASQMMKPAYKLALP